MNFAGYLLLGALLYGAGFAIYYKVLKPKALPRHSPLAFGLTAICFVVMLMVSYLLGRFVLGHASPDMAYIMVNSLVGTVVFYFGLCPDEKRLPPPD